MKNRRIKKTAFSLAVLLAASITSAKVTSENPIIRGRARFTVVTPGLVRMEYSPDGKFVDDKSMFAVGRDVKAEKVSVDTTGADTIIDTGGMKVTFHSDGKEFSADNLSVTGGGNVNWKPGQKNAQNLGGTTRTLDGFDGSAQTDPGLLSRDGWFYLDDSHTALFTESGWVKSREHEGNTDGYLFVYGNDYKSALKAMTVIGGPIPIPRKYTLGVWFSRYWPFSSQDYRNIIKEYADHGFPLDNIVMDMDWHNDGWTGYSWNRKLLPDAEDLLKWFHSEGLAVTLNDHPADGVGPQEDMFAQFQKDMGADPSAKKAIPFDAANEKYLSTFYKDTHLPLEKEGVDFWWLDWQQYPNTRSIKELSNLFWLNHYYYQKTSHPKAAGEEPLRGQDLSRWGGWGSHRYPIQFSGDASTSFRMLAFEVPFTAASGNAGCFFWSHDIGGHNRGRNEESYARWCQFGATSAALRSHSTRDATMDRRPWTYPYWAEESMRLSFHLRSELFPYIYSSAAESCQQSIPLNRAMYIDYPQQDQAYQNPQEYLFGDHLLVAPIAEPGMGPNKIGRQVVWFPAGDWYNILTGEKYSGNSESLVAADINEFPIYARAGVPIPMQAYTPRMATSSLKELIVRCYPGTEGATGTFTLYEDDGVTTAYQKGASATTELSYTRTGNDVTIKIAPTKGTFKDQVTSREFTVELPCTAKATSVKVDGSSDTSTYDADNFVNKVVLPARDIRQGVTINVTVENAGEMELQKRAFVRRAGVDPSVVTGAENFKQVVAKVLATDAAKSDSTIALAAAGVAVFPKNETFYGYPETPNYYLYAPADLLDTRTIKFSTSGEDNTIPDNQNKLLIPEANAAAALPSNRVKVDATLNINGKPATLSSESAPLNFKTIADNIAPQAKVTASGSEGRYRPRAVIDGIADGYPTAAEHEWSSGTKAGGWIQLTWPEAQSIDRVCIFGRVDDVDTITSGTLTFDDGSTLPVGKIDATRGKGALLQFPVKSVKWMKFTIDGLSEKAENGGLSEIVVLKPAITTK